MATEDISPRFKDFDLWDNAAALRALWEGQLAAVAGVGAVLASISDAVDAAVPRLRGGGRLIYAGAGTSARIAVQDGAELTPTFGWPRERVAFVIAGGEAALLQAIEDAEDMGASAQQRIAELDLGEDDVVLAAAASGETPFTVAAVEAARTAGALTISIANTPGSRLARLGEHAIVVETGPEPIAGSTRLNAGAAQKVTLNLISTLIMVRLGKVHGGLMVHMRPTNAKLRRRAQRMVQAIVKCDDAAAQAALQAAGHDIKLAVLIAGGMEREAGRTLLAKHDGNLRLALAEAAPQTP